MDHFDSQSFRRKTIFFFIQIHSNIKSYIDFCQLKDYNVWIDLHGQNCFDFFNKNLLLWWHHDRNNFGPCVEDCVRKTNWFQFLLFMLKLVLPTWFMERFEDILSLDEDMLGTEEYHNWIEVWLIPFVAHSHKKFNFNSHSFNFLQSTTLVLPTHTRSLVCTDFPLLG